MRLMMIGWLVLLMGAPVAMAQPGPDGPRGERFRKRMLRQFDKNGDGKLSPAERREMRAMMRLRRRQMLKKFDTNKDGRLDQTERQAMRAQRRARRQRMLKKFDKNNDGKLDRSERVAMRAHRRASRAIKRFDGLLKKHDRNRDGQLSWAEIKPNAPGQVKRMRRRFTASDADGNGVVTRDEFIKAAHRINRTRRGKRPRRPMRPGKVR